MKKTESYSGLVTHLDRKSLKGKAFYAFLVICLCIAAAVSLFPLLWAAISGFKTPQEFYAIPPTLFPKEFQIENAVELFTVYKIQNYALNSLLVIIGALIVEIVFTATAGFVLSRIRPIGGKLLFTLVLWTMMMPATISMVPLFLTFIDIPFLHINLMNTYVPMWLIAATNCFHIVLFKNFFDGIPLSYIEAATVDGASKLHIFYRIIIPLSKPILATVCVFSITTSWNEFMWSLLMLKDKERRTIGLALYYLKSDLQEPQLLIFSVIVTIPMIIVYFIAQRFVVTNSVSVGVKG